MHAHTDMLEEVSVVGPGYDCFLCHCHCNIKEQMKLTEKLKFVDAIRTKIGYENLNHITYF
jgi:hypothetical protein